ncbi:hypothetical protein [Clostridium sporogenes]|uniref:hypothetical protein n=1 Tax=Clostridium sporogenes TaxID=1509 RepID=UPI001F2B15DE|nr:hypothetical protein [Clostridium sporogenes]UJA31175.1 hypothetical protein L0894_13775 [Clostridium sporogenes]
MENFQRIVFSKIANKALNKIKRKVYIKDEVLILKQQYKQEDINFLDNIDIKILNEKDLESLSQKKSQTLKGEIAQGNIIYGIIINDQIAHYSCVAFKSHAIREINKIFILPTEGIYIFNCYTFEKYRGKQLYYIMLKFLSREYKNLDKYIVVSRYNKISYHVIKKAGFFKIAEFKYKKIFNKEELLMIDVPKEIREHLIKFE